jgi:flagellar assembly protein FliH
MKSSPKLIPAAQIQAWNPTELAPTQTAPDPMLFSNLMSVFEPNRRAEDQASESDRLIKVGISYSISHGWAPEDFTACPPDARQTWRTSNEKQRLVEPILTPTEIAKKQADLILQQAQTEAEAILQAAREKADEVTLDAHREGWTAAEKETQDMLSTAKSIVQQTTDWRDEMLAQSEGAVIELVKEIAAKLFADGFVLDSAMLQQTFNQALEGARSLGDLRIYVHPDDAANIDPYWREFQVSISGKQVQIIPSEAIKRGGCFVNGQLGTVDARIDTQLKAIIDTLSENDTPSQDESHGDQA